MKYILDRLKEWTVLACTGGLIYICIELAWRGWTDITMFFVGGIAFLIGGMMNELYTFEMPLCLQSIKIAVMITVIEYIAGSFINTDYTIWDYRNKICNLNGQICLEYFFWWFLLAFAIIIVDDYLRYWWFKEEKPHYKLF